MATFPPFPHQAMAALTPLELSACLPSGACTNGAWDLTISGSVTDGFCGTGKPAVCEAGIARALGKFDHGVGQVRGFVLAIGGENTEWGAPWSGRRA